MVECAGKPLGHGERMSNRQVLDIHRSEAHARPRHHQFIPSQYRKGWVRGKRAWSSGRERGKTYSRVPAQALLGKMSCWNNIPSKRSKDELESLGACYEG